MECPNCKLMNPPTAQRCDCGYDFASGAVVTSYLSPEEKERTAHLTRWYWPKASPSTYKAALVFGWLMVAGAAVLLVRTAITLLTGVQVIPTPIPFGVGESMGWEGALPQGLLYLAAGLAVLKRRRIAVNLVWALTILSGLGVLLRGLVPIDILFWIASLWIAKWYSTKKPLLR